MRTLWDSADAAPAVGAAARENSPIVRCATLHRRCELKRNSHACAQKSHAVYNYELYKRHCVSVLCNFYHFQRHVSAVLLLLQASTAADANNTHYVTRCSNSSGVAEEAELH